MTFAEFKIALKIQEETDKVVDASQDDTVMNCIQKVNDDKIIMLCMQETWTSGV